MTVHVDMCILEDVCPYVCICVCQVVMYIHVCVYMYAVYMDGCVLVFICMYVHVFVCLYIHVHVHIYTHICRRMYMCEMSCRVWCKSFSLWGLMQVFAQALHVVRIRVSAGCADLNLCLRSHLTRRP